MKLTLKIKLLPSEEQIALLLQTIKQANEVCNDVSIIAWDKKIFNQYKLHKEVYHSFKSSSSLSAQTLVRCISKVTDAYKIDKKTKRDFRPLGSVAYDSRILTYKMDNIISIWGLGGRIQIPFVCHNEDYLPYIRGEADLFYKKGKFYLYQTIDVPVVNMKSVNDFVGVDFGITDIAVTSDGVKHSADSLNAYREYRQKVRSSIQSKGTRNSKKLLKRLSGKENTTATIVNHTIAKSIIESAKSNNKGVAVEDLKNIRFNGQKRNKSFRTKLGKWSFNQLRNFLEYKALLNGVPFVVVKPNYTSKTCSNCYHIGDRKNKSFNCPNCSNDMDADYNASRNITLLGAVVNQPEKSDMLSCTWHCSDLKPLNL